jgi:hypothetical protein
MRFVAVVRTLAFLASTTAVVILVGCGSGGPGDVAVTATSASPTTTVVPHTVIPDMSATVIPELAEKLKVLNDFRAQKGEPPDANAGRMRIPRIGVDAAIDERIALRTSNSAG